jgi:putative endonuclease
MKTEGRLQRIGKWGEDLAAQYLIGQGYTLLARNLRTPYGEIDLVMQDGREMVFVEVKARTSRSLGNPEISVTPAKQRHLVDSVEYYFQQHPELVCDWRVDVIAIQGKLGTSEPEIVWFKNALS